MFFPALSLDQWRKVATRTSVMTFVVCMLATIGVLIFNWATADRTVIGDIFSTNTVSFFLTFPIFGFLSIKLEELRCANSRLRHLANTDYLTGTLNRRAFIEEIEILLGKPKRADENKGSALLVIDVDHFKSINDRYGHQTGDKALIQIVELLRTRVFKTDLFGRLGGEEFGIFLENVTPAVALRIAENCRIAVKECHFAPDGNRHELTVSIGIAIPGDNDDFNTFFQVADRMLYRAKDRGRDRVESLSIATAV